MVVCAVCQESMNVITWKHVKKHEMTLYEYKERFPTHPIKSEEAIRRKREAATKANRDRVGVPRSTEVVNKIKATKAKSSSPAWNKGVARTEQQNRHLSEVRKERFAAGEIIHWNLGNTTPEETRQKISSTSLAQQRTYTDASRGKREATINQKKNDGWVHHGTAAFEAKLNASINTNATTLFNDREWLYDQHINQRKSIASICVMLGLHWKREATTLQRKFKELNIPVHRWSDHISAQQLEIERFLDSLGVTYISNVRNIIAPYELDIFLPDYNIAIEYNGLFWHCESSGKDATYHLMKTTRCEAVGVRLIHIMEDEWRDQTQKCKDTIKHLLNKSDKGTYARNTVIREIDWPTAKNFLDRYHLLNAGSAGSYRIGAYAGEELIGVMVFGTKTNEGSNKMDVELKRFVTNKKNNPGLGSKMFKYAITQQHYNRVVAFVDRRWFTGLVKHYIGFKVIGETAPAIWWTNGTDRFHRRVTTKARLKTPSMTKRESLRQLGMVRIWDCGKLKLEWTTPEL